MDEQFLVQDGAHDGAQEQQRHVAPVEPERPALPRDQGEHERATDGAHERDRAGWDVREREPTRDRQGREADLTGEHDQMDRERLPG